jgi:peroxiredoxin Q/BCP
LGVHIVGCGFDTPEDNQAWAEDEGYEYEIWTDSNKTLALTYGAASSKSTSYPSRVTVVLDEKGMLALTYAVSSIGTHPAQVLSDVTQLYGD